MCLATEGLIEHYWADCILLSGVSGREVEPLVYITVLPKRPLTAFFVNVIASKNFSPCRLTHEGSRNAVNSFLTTLGNTVGIPAGRFGFGNTGLKLLLTYIY
jgi:hypothetical protein